MKTSYSGSKLTVQIDRDSEKLALSVIAKFAEDIAFLHELSNTKVKDADARVSDMEWCMDKANAEIAEIKDKWWFRASAYMASCVTNWKGGR